ncbi:16696_t:CDS:2, partial [Acaulospora morrowiae]
TSVTNVVKINRPNVPNSSKSGSVETIQTRKDEVRQGDARVSRTEIVRIVSNINSPKGTVDSQFSGLTITSF